MNPTQNLCHRDIKVMVLSLVALVQLYQDNHRFLRPTKGKFCVMFKDATSKKSLFLHHPQHNPADESSRHLLYYYLCEVAIRVSKPLAIQGEFYSSLYKVI